MNEKCKLSGKLSQRYVIYRKKGNKNTEIYFAMA